MDKTKKCARCYSTKSIDKFVNIYGFKNVRGKYCISCFHERQQEHAMELLEGRDFCLYCGERITKAYDWTPTGSSAKTYVNRDHMNPLALGGEDTQENTVYCCVTCNLKKGKKTYREWLQCLSTKNREFARKIYIEKQGQSPENFVPTDPNVTIEIKLFCD